MSVLTAAVEKLKADATGVGQDVKRARATTNTLVAPIAQRVRASTTSFVDTFFSGGTHPELQKLLPPTLSASASTVQAGPNGGAVPTGNQQGPVLRKVIATGRRRLI